MRVITGTARGRTLKTLDGLEVRPTAQKIKESVFSIIQFQIEGRVFLDLFAGSGQMGIEALSRGAKTAYFVDKSRASLAVTEQNLRLCGLAENARLVCCDAAAFIRTRDIKYDIAFLDPPYRLGLLEELAEPLSRRMNRGGIIICEAPADKALAPQAGDFALLREYRYGKTKIVTYCAQELCR